MFVVLIHYKQPITEVEKHLASHRAYLGECYKKDYFIASGPQNPRTGGVILSQLSDKNQLQEVIHQDPFHINGVSDF